MQPDRAMPDNQDTQIADAARPAVGGWLLLCSVLVAAMVVLGGATRLTESGLSIVDWRPVTGILPPLDQADWQALFDAYRQSPEFRHVNFWMTLADFKAIYWLEYLHRLWGRVIGVVFFVPFLWLLVRRRIGTGFALRLGGLFALGALQGLLGWYMVKSGLVERTDVSQYRLAAHLALAFVIYGWLLWLALRCLRPAADAMPGARIPLRGHAVGVLGGALLTIVAGAFVAGIDAGLAYNTFPLMDGRLVPPGALQLEPWWLNFFENTATVQFTHRLLGVTLAAGVLGLWLRARPMALAPVARRVLHGLAAVAALQVALGIATLLTAVALFTLALWAVYELGAAPPAPAGTRRPNSAAPSTKPAQQTSSP